MRAVMRGLKFIIPRKVANNKANTRDAQFRLVRLVAAHFAFFSLFSDSRFENSFKFWLTVSFNELFTFPCDDRAFNDVKPRMIDAVK